MTGRVNRPMVLDGRGCQQLLDDIRDRMEKIRDGRANPQYGTNIEEETDLLLESFKRLDDSLSGGSHYPRDWR